MYTITNILQSMLYNCLLTLYQILLLQNLQKTTNLLVNVRNFHRCCKLLKEATNLKGKSHSSQLWLQRQLKDIYVEKARMENYRCRSAFKLLEINESQKIFAPGQIVIDCGAAPGSWTQVAAKMTNANGKAGDQPLGKVIAIDRLPFHPIEGVEMLPCMDFTSAIAQKKICSILNKDRVDVFMSDMAPNATGMRDMDHENIMYLVYSALKFSMRLMKTGGSFLAKVWDGGKSSQLESDLLKFYRSVKIVRPQATRTESSEMFFLAKGFKGIKTDSPK